jgi:hypothetical protein
MGIYSVWGCVSPWIWCLWIVENEYVSTKLNRVHPSTKHRLELLLFTFVACIGAFIRGLEHRHWGWGPNLSKYREHIIPWIVDVTWLFALVAAAVVGLRGKFSGARPVGVICAVIVVTMGLAGTMGILLYGVVLAILVLVQFIELIVYHQVNNQTNTD